MAKVEIIGPKDDLMPVLEMLRGRGVFQPDPQLLKGVKFPAQERPKALILDEDDLKEREYFQALLRRVKELIGLLPAVDVSASPLQPLPVMDVLDQMVDHRMFEFYLFLPYPLFVFPQKALLFCATPDRPNDVARITVPQVELLVIAQRTNFIVP
jgi:hypothetical protein